MLSKERLQLGDASQSFLFQKELVESMEDKDKKRGKTLCYNYHVSVSHFPLCQILYLLL